MSVNILRRGGNPHNLPAGYQEVEYIESTGEQYIDTGVYANSNTGLSIDFKNNGSGVDRFGICYVGKPTNYQFGIVYDYRYMFFSGTSFYNLSWGESRFSRLNVELISSTLKINGEQKATYSSNFQNNYYPIALFAVSDASIYQYASMNLYSCTLYDSLTPIRNFIPCYRRSDNKPGLYDLNGSICPLTNSPFYTNANTSATQDFITGPEVGFDIQEVQPYVLKKGGPLWDAGYQEVEYLESTGQQRILSNYKANNKTDITAIVQTDTNSPQRFFGDMTSTATAYCLALPGTTSSTYIRYAGGQGFYSSTNISYVGDWHSVRNNYTGYYVDDTLLYSWQPTGTWVQQFGCDMFYYYGSYTKIKLKSLIISEDGVVNYNFIPCYRRSDHKPGMYDTINSQFYTNANTSASQDFIVGPDVNKYVLQPVSVNVLPMSLWGTPGLAYTLSQDGTYYICSGIGTATDTDIVIGALHNGKQVKSVGFEAFRNNKRIISVILPFCLTRLEGYSFYGSSIKTINLFEGLVYIGHSSFTRTSLTGVVIPSTVTNYSGAFNNCDGLKSAIIKTTTKINDWCFGFSTQLKKIVVNTNQKVNVDSTSFSSINSNAVFYFPTSLIESYESDSVWSNYHQLYAFAPLVATITERDNLDTTIYTKACVIGNEEYTEYTYDGSQWNEVTN